jgi:hypothetical protein
MICAFGPFLWRVLPLVAGHTLGEGVAMDAEDDSGFREVLFVTGEGFLDVELFEFADRFVEKDMAFKHFVDQSFESGMNQSSFPVNNRYASR